MPLRYAAKAAEAYEAPLTIRHLLDNVLLTAAEQEIIYRDRFRYTYRDFVGRVGRLASLLAEQGATEGTTVAVMDWDSHRYLEAYFAVPMMGAVLQTVNVRMPPPQIAYTLDHAAAEVLLLHRDFLPVFEELRASLPRLRKVVMIDEGVGDPLPVWAAGEYEALSAAASPDYLFADFHENAIATTFYTTGTTGDPKGVCFSHRQLVLHALTVNGAFGSSQLATRFGYGDVYMPLTPMFHVHAWGMPYVAAMLGLKQVYPGRYEPDLICRLRAEHGVTYSHCVPTILQMVLNASEQNGTDLSGWKVTIGGSALTKSLWSEATARGMEVVAGYGMSETAPTISIARPKSFASAAEEAAQALTSAGVPVPMVAARVVDEHMRDVAHDGSARGELVLRAPWLTQCYVGNPAASEALWRGGWMHTQDVATIDPDGTIRIRDRLKDVIKTGGEWVDSIQLEDLIATADGVAEAAIIAVPDPKWGERPLAVIVQGSGATVTLEALNRPVNRAIEQGQITRYARLDRFEIVADLPRTSVGKIDKKVLRARFEAAATEVAS